MVTLRVALVAVFVTVTEAFGIRAPDESLTSPLFLQRSEISGSLSHSISKAPITRGGVLRAE